MIDYVSEELAQAIADYANQLFSQGKTVDKFAVMGAFIAYREQDFNELLEAIKHD
jgi:hypothetical protein